MAILKHVPSHNANYAAVIDYLTKEHDEETGEALLDEHGQMVERKEYLIEGINCTPENFAEMCMKDCLKFRANRAESDIKTHQYILSFDPKDRERGLTLAAAQEEGVAFAQRNFPGHRCIICAHPDGLNGSGNIHVHIVFCSVRFEAREPNAAFMKLKSDGSVKESECKAGCKHQDTARLRIYLNDQLQEYCRENGYTVTEQKPAKKITNKEYKVKQAGQKQLDKDNAARRKKGQLPVQTEYKTKKDDLRAGITQAVSNAKNWDELAYNLRHSLTRQVEQQPSEKRIPYKARQEMWEQYKAINDDFWLFYHVMADDYKEDIDTYFQMLRERSEVDWGSRNRHNSFIERLIAIWKLWKMDTKEDIKYDISEAKEEQKKLRLYKDVYQAYAKAAKIALANNMQEEAADCLGYMEELRQRKNGYWIDGLIRDATAVDYSAGFGQPKSFYTWRHTTENELAAARNKLQRIQQHTRELEDRRVQPELREKPFPIDIKVSRGMVSFKHPDMERWTRGKSLGAEFEMETLARVMEENRLRDLDEQYHQALKEASKESHPPKTTNTLNPER